MSYTWNQQIHTQQPGVYPANQPYGLNCPIPIPINGPPAYSQVQPVLSTPHQGDLSGLVPLSQTDTVFVQEVCSL